MLPCALSGYFPTLLLSSTCLLALASTGYWLLLSVQPIDILFVFSVEDFFSLLSSFSPFSLSLSYILLCFGNMPPEKRQRAFKDSSSFWSLSMSGHVQFLLVYIPQARRE